jgi:hypothetical protein
VFNITNLKNIKNDRMEIIKESILIPEKIEMCGLNFICLIKVVDISIGTKFGLE